MLERAWEKRRQARRCGAGSGLAEGGAPGSCTQDRAGGGARASEIKGTCGKRAGERLVSDCEQHILHAWEGYCARMNELTMTLPNVPTPRTLGISYAFFF